MALFAKDKDETVSAWDAETGKRYECLECQTPLKLRTSKLKFPHFYHVSTSRYCRLYSKSEKHLLIQYEIQKKIPGTILEKPFPSIGRIADVVWEEKQMIFEIQCSFITEKEVKERTEEYRSLGYEIIWLLDDRKFNKKHLSAAENWIRCKYFVDKNLLFYDQLEIVRDQKRIGKGSKIPIRLSPRQKTKWPESLPEQVRERTLNKYYFENDILDRSLRSELAYLQAAPLSKWALFKEIFTQVVRKPYVAFLNSLLKRSL